MSVTMALPPTTSYSVGMSPPTSVAYSTTGTGLPQHHHHHQQALPSMNLLASPPAYSAPGTSVASTYVPPPNTASHYSGGAYGGITNMSEASLCDMEPFKDLSLVSEFGSVTGPTLVQRGSVSPGSSDSDSGNLTYTDMEAKKKTPKVPNTPPASTASQASTSKKDTNIQVADSNSPKQTFVPCKVCGDKASGYHYGVTSCEGCKGFFRRSIQKQIEYRCLRDGKCMVIRLNRNRCQYCRFKKCLAVGMSRDSVRYGRVPKRSKSQDERQVSTTDGAAGQDAVEVESRQLAIYDIILTISQAHHANCTVTEDKVKNLTRKPISLLTALPKLDYDTGFTTEMLEKQRCMMFQNLAGLITPTIQRVVEFAKRVAGFHELSQDDQLILIKAGFFEIWLIRLARMYNNIDNTLTFGDGSIVPRSELEVVYTSELLEAMFEFAQGFVTLHLNDTEIGLFTGIVLATADRQSLSDAKAVEKIQDKLIEALKLQISRNHSTEPHLFANVLMKLPELRLMGTKHADVLQWFRTHWSLVRLPPLFAEIYDIPKSNEDLQS